MYFTKLTELEFINHAEDHELANFMQTPAMRRLRSRRGWETAYVGVKDDQGQVLLSALLGEKPLKLGKIFDIDGGFLGDFSNSELLQTFISGLKKQAEQEGVLYLNLNPNVVYQQYDDCGQEQTQCRSDIFKLLCDQGFIHQGFTHGMSDLTPRWYFIKNLQGLDEKSLRKTYNENTVHSLKLAHDFGVKIRSLKYDELDQFKKITKETAIRRGFTDKPLSYYQILFEEFKEHAKFLVAEINFQDYSQKIASKINNLTERLTKIDLNLHERPNSSKMLNQKREFSAQLQAQQERFKLAQQLVQENGTNDVILAGALFIVTKKEVVYLFSGMYQRYSKFEAPFLLQDTMMNWAINKKIPRFNFFGIDGVFDGSDGVFKFKKSFGGYVEEQLGTFIFPFQPLKYKCYQFLHRIREKIKM